MSTKTTTKTNTNAQAKLIAEVKHDEQAKINLTDEQLLTEITDRFESVATKSAMLKAIRADKFKVSQDRCYNMYLRYALAAKADAKATV